MAPKKRDGAKVPPTNPDPADSAVMTIFTSRRESTRDVESALLARRALRVSYPKKRICGK